MPGAVRENDCVGCKQLDVKTSVLDREPDCSASSVCSVFIKGDPSDYNDVLNFGKMVDMFTYEIENINVNALKDLKREGKEIYPEPEVQEIIQDKGLQKTFLRSKPFHRLNLIYSIT